jgi:ADP-heptose:LPS heptosyltransferase
MQAILEECLRKRREQTTILNPIATPNTDYIFWEEGKFDGNKTFVENLYLFSKHILQLPNATRSNGIVIPKGVTPQKYPKKVVIHPTSSRPGKNWPKKKFIALAELLRKEGFDPFFVVGPKEKEDWPESVSYTSLSHLFTLVCESGYMIGNDSGIGHLASCLGLPTLTLFQESKDV